MKVSFPIKQDYNITEKPYGTSRRKMFKIYKQGEKLYDIRLLHAVQSTSNWVNHSEYQQQIFSKKPRKVHIQKLFINKINGKTSESNMVLKNQSKNYTDIKEEFKTSNTAINAITDGNLSYTDTSDPCQTESMQGPKTIYNHTVDAFRMVENRKGFLHTNTINSDETLVNDQSNRFQQIIGVYCVRWRRAGDISENESKFIINSLEIVEAPLNIYCYLDEKMYVKVPMTLRIILRNTTNSTLLLKSCLKNADNFMFAGHSQVYIIIIIYHKV